MTDVFISYSRKDREFVRTLNEALTRAGRDAWVDLEDIPPTAEWLREIYAGIEAANTVVFVLSPDSVASEVCVHEVAHAAEHQKRLVPIVRREVDPKAVPPELAARNWILFRVGDEFEYSFQILLNALDTDLEWVREHTRLLTRAIEWDSEGRDASLLLRGGDLRDAEQWLAGVGSDKEPQPTPLQTQYLLASRAAATKQQRVVLGAVTLGLVVAIALGVGLWFARSEAVFQADAALKAQATAVTEAEVRATAEAVAVNEAQVRATAEANAEARRAEAERQQRIATSRQLATQALSQVSQQPDLALLLSLEAGAIQDTLEARTSLFSSLGHSPRLATFLHGHQNGVTSLAFSRDGRKLASGDFSGRVIVWDVAARRPLYPPLEAAKGQLFSVALSPDGKILAAGGKFGELTFWDADTGKPVGQPITGVPSGHWGWVTSVAFSPDGKILASASLSGSVFLWDVATQKLQVELAGGHQGQANTVAFSPDGKTLASGGMGERDNIVLWDVGARRPLGLRFSQPGYVWGVAFSPDGRRLVSNGHGLNSSGDLYERTTVVWNLETGLPLDPGLMITGSAQASFSPDGRFLASTGRSGISLWDVESRQPLAPPLAFEAGVSTVNFSPDGRTLASSTAEHVVLWDVSTDLPLGKRLSGHTTPVCSIAFNAQGAVLASGSDDGQILLWDVATGHKVQSLVGEPGGTFALAFSPDDQVLASAHVGGVALWDVPTYRPIGSTLAHRSATQLVFSPDARTLVTATLDRVNVWDTTSRQRVSEHLGGRDVPPLSPSAKAQPRCSNAFGRGEMALSPDGRLRAVAEIPTGPGSMAVALWDTATGERIHVFETDSYAPTLAFSPDGRFLAAGGGPFGNHPVSGYQTYVWELASRQLAAPPLKHTQPLESVAFSPDGHTLASGDITDGDVTLWDIATGERLGPPLFSGPGRVSTLQFSPGGDKLASNNHDETVVLWDVSLEAWRGLACRVANRNLSRFEWNRFIGSQVDYRQTCPTLPPNEDTPSRLKP